MVKYLGAPEAGQEWTIEDVYALSPNEYPPWNPEGRELNPADFPTRKAFDDEKNRLIDESGYRALYTEFQKGPPGSTKRVAYEAYASKKMWRNILIGAGVIGAAFMAFGG